MKYRFFTINWQLPLLKKKSTASSVNRLPICVSASLICFGLYSSLSWNPEKEKLTNAIQRH